MIRKILGVLKCPSFFQRSGTTKVTSKAWSSRLGGLDQSGLTLSQTDRDSQTRFGRACHPVEGSAQELGNYPCWFSGINLVLSQSNIAVRTNIHKSYVRKHSRELYWLKFSRMDTTFDKMIQFLWAILFWKSSFKVLWAKHQTVALENLS